MYKYMSYCKIEKRPDAWAFIYGYIYIYTQFAICVHSTFPGHVAASANVCSRFLVGCTAPLPLASHGCEQKKGEQNSQNQIAKEAMSI